MSKQLLLLMLGFPGSGKSYFAERLAREMSALHLNSDAMRLAIFGSRDETDRIYHSDYRPVLNTYTFGAMNYVAQSVLKAGSSVVYDANNNTRQERLEIIKSLNNSNVQVIVVWVQTSVDVAVRRSVKRRESTTQRQLSAEDASVYIEKIASQIEEPGDEEKVIKIDGVIGFEGQYRQFREQLKKGVSNV